MDSLAVKMTKEQMSKIVERDCLNVLCTSNGGNGVEMTAVSSDSNCHVVFNKRCPDCGHSFDIKYKVTFEYGVSEPTTRLSGFTIKPPKGAKPRFIESAVVAECRP